VRVGRWYLLWRLVYTLALLVLGVYSVAHPNEDIGADSGYLLLAFGVAPSLLLLVLAGIQRRPPFVLVRAYGALILGVTLFSAAGGNPVVAVCLLPLAGFPIEWLVLYFKFGANGPPRWT